MLTLLFCKRNRVASLRCVMGVGVASICAIAFRNCLSLLMAPNQAMLMHWRRLISRYYHSFDGVRLCDLVGAFVQYSHISAFLLLLSPFCSLWLTTARCVTCALSLSARTHPRTRSTSTSHSLCCATGP